MAKMTKKALEELFSGLLAKHGLSPESIAERNAAEAAAVSTSQRRHTTGIQRTYAERAKGMIASDQYAGKGLRAGRFIRCMAAAGGNHEMAARVAKSWGDDWLADSIMESVERALNESTFASGGALLPEEFMNEMIEVLRSRSVMRAAGAGTLPMSTGTLAIPRQAAAASAGYIGEGNNISKSEQTFEQIILVAKKLAVLTPISNDLIRDASPMADRIVRDDLAAVMALREDLAFMRDDGTSNTPRGLRYATLAANIAARTQAGATSTLAEILGDLHLLMRKVEQANVPMLRPGWLMTSRTKFGLMQLRDGVGSFLLREEMNNGTLFGVPFYISNQIPTNLTAGDETELYFVEFSQCIIGESETLSIDVLPNATYHDGSALQSGVSRDETVVRAIARHDFALRHPEACSIATAVDWGV